MSSIVTTSRFDEIEWLSSFNAVGGWCCIGVQGNLAAGWQMFGRSEADQAEARRLYSEIFDHPQAFMRRHQLADLLAFAHEAVR